MGSCQGCGARLLPGKGWCRACRETPNIFVLTVMWLDADGREPQGRDKRRERTWGWFPSLELAETTVTSKDGHIYEDGYYNVALIEEIPWGSLAIPRAEHWYSASMLKPESDERALYDVKKIDKPEAFRSVCSFGMG